MEENTNPYRTLDGRPLRRRLFIRLGCKMRG
jgi:hypothetical protein